MRGSAVVASRTEALTPQMWSEPWPAVLRSTQARLNAMVKELGAEGADATLLYTSPDATAGLYSCPRTAGRIGAQLAARLALGEAASFPLDHNPFDLVVFAKDVASRTGRGADGQRHVDAVHTLGVADTDANTQALAQWLTVAGLLPAALYPAVLPGIVTACRTALRASRDGVCVVYALGEHVSVLAAASGGSLRFVRQLAIGVETMVEALSREIRPKNPELPPVRLERDEARVLLLSSGIPERGAIFDEARGIAAESILPLIQPVLQRCVVETKQSLRFGLSETERADARLVTIGPGAAVPRLASVIAEQIGLAVDLESGGASTVAGAPAGLGSLLLAEPMRVRLLPRELQSASSARRIKRGVLVGFAAASLAVAADAVLTRIDLSAKHRDLNNLRVRLGAADPMIAMNARLVGMKAGVLRAEAGINTAFGAVAEWDTVLQVLAGMVPPSIKLGDIALQFETGEPVCRISGHVFPDEAASSSVILKGFVDSISALPIVRTCRLGGTHRADETIGGGQRFELSFAIIGLPLQAIRGTPPASARTTHVPPEGP